MPLNPLPFLGILKLGDIPLSIYVGQGQNHIGRIAEHPYYRSLNENDHNIFNDFYHCRSDLPGFQDMHEYSWEGFIALKDKIQLEGWRPELGPDIVVRDDGQRDGTHRLCILYFLHGPEALVMILDGKIIFPVPSLPDEVANLMSITTKELFLGKIKKISEYELLNNQLDSRLREALNELETVTIEKKAILTSNSWRMTKPFRKIKDWILGFSSNQ